MKISLRRMAVLGGLCAFGLVSKGWAQEKVAPVVVPGPAQNADLVALGAKLQALILGARTNARIEVNGNSLRVMYHTAQSRNRIPFESDIVEIPNAPTDFSLGLRVEEGFVGSRAENRTRTAASFGTLLLGLYRLKRLPDVDFARQSVVVPSSHWAYAAYSKSVAAIGGLPLAFEGKLMTRYEFAVGIAHLHSTRQVDSKSDGLIGELLDAMNREFADELTLVGGEMAAVQEGGTSRRWQPCYEYLALSLAHGKWVDSALMEKIENVIADYAAQRLAANGDNEF